MTRMRRSLIAAVMLLALVPGEASALPPHPPSAAKTRSAISHLKIATPLSMNGYSRNRFPHWTSQGGGCDTRDRVLIRDGRNVRVGPGCRIVSGTWRSFYDGLTFTSSSRVDIDHVVPLANAWRSGARRWNDERRRHFAYDLDDSQLIAVSATSNRSKGDQGSEAWKPPRRAAWCLYSRWWAGEAALAPHRHAARADGAAADGGDLLMAPVGSLSTMAASRPYWQIRQLQKTSQIA